MKIIVLTSSDHLYANLLLKDLIQKGLFSKHSLIVFEQDSIIPRKSKIKGLITYFNISGYKYILYQLIKVYIFKIMSFISNIKANSNSIYYPYYKNNLRNFDRQVVNNIKRPEIVAKVSSIKPDLILSILSKEIIPNSIINIPKLGCINLHPAFLPFYRGVSPTFWVLANQEKNTGITLHYIDTKIDTGNIIDQRKFSLKKYKTEHAVYMKCMKEGKEMLAIFLDNTIKKNKIETIKNPKKGTYYSIPTKKAVNAFLKNGYKFFTWKELFKPN
jgi:methionyl-tRNA formyltransferase